RGNSGVQLQGRGARNVGRVRASVGLAHHLRSQMKSHFVEECRSVIALLVSMVVVGLTLFSGPGMFAVWYWFLQLVALVVASFTLRTTLSRILPTWVIDISALAVSAAAAIGVSYSIAFSDGPNAALRAGQLAAICTLPTAAVAFVLVILSRRYIRMSDVG